MTEETEERIREAMILLRDCTDGEMKDGDLAREKAREVLEMLGSKTGTITQGMREQIAMRCGYIIGPCVGEAEMMAEARKILEILGEPQ